MAKMERKTFDTPQETRMVDKGKIEVVKLGDVTALGYLPPEFRWLGTRELEQDRIRPEKQRTSTKTDRSVKRIIPEI